PQPIDGQRERDENRNRLCHLENRHRRLLPRHRRSRATVEWRELVRPEDRREHARDPVAEGSEEPAGPHRVADRTGPNHVRPGKPNHDEGQAGQCAGNVRGQGHAWIGDCRNGEASQHGEQDEYEAGANQLTIGHGFLREFNGAPARYNRAKRAARGLKPFPAILRHTVSERGRSGRTSRRTTMRNRTIQLAVLLTALLPLSAGALFAATNEETEKAITATLIEKLGDDAKTIRVAFFDEIG